MALRVLTGLNGPDQPHLVSPSKALPVDTRVYLSLVWDLQTCHELCLGCWSVI